MIHSHIYNLQLFLLLSRMMEFSNFRIVLLYSVVTACCCTRGRFAKAHTMPTALKCFAFVVHTYVLVCMCELFSYTASFEILTLCVPIE